MEIALLIKRPFRFACFFTWNALRKVAVTNWNGHAGVRKIYESWGIKVPW